MMPLAHHSLSAEHEKLLWDKKVLNMETSKGLSRSVIFYLIKCFALWQGKELRHLETGHVTFGEDDLGAFVALDLQNATSFKQRKLTKRYDDPANPRSVYKIMKKYRSYVANEGPFLVRPISSIKDFVCYSPLPLGVNVIETSVSTMMKDVGLGVSYVNYSLNLQAVDTLYRFGTGSHCLASWLFKNGLKGMPPAPHCGPTNCEDFNPEISLMMSRLLDAPYPLDAVEIIQKMERIEQMEEQESAKSPAEKFDSWMSNIISKKKVKDILRQKMHEEEEEGSRENGIEVNGESNNIEEEEEGEDAEVETCRDLQQLKTSTTSFSMSSSKKASHSKSHSIISSHSSKTTKKRQHSGLRISSVSSISEGAFSMHGDGSIAETRHSQRISRKRKRPSTHGLPLQGKRLKKCLQRSKESPSQGQSIDRNEDIKREIEESERSNVCEDQVFKGNAGQMESENCLDGNCSDGCSFDREVKQENIDESEPGDAGPVNVPSNLTHESDGEVVEPIPEKELNEDEDNLGMGENGNLNEIHGTSKDRDSLLNSCLETVNTLKKEGLLASSTDKELGRIPISSRRSSKCAGERHRSSSEAEDDHKFGMQRLEQKLRDSIAVLRELRQSTLKLKLSSESEEKKDQHQSGTSYRNSSSSSSFNADDTNVQEESKSQAVSFSDIDSTVEEEDREEEDLTIDLSPPVLSPQIPGSPTDGNNKTIESELEDRVSSLMANRSAAKSFFSSTSSDIMQFLDKANKHIKDLLKGTGAWNEEADQADSASPNEEAEQTDSGCPDLTDFTKASTPNPSSSSPESSNSSLCRNNITSPDKSTPSFSAVSKNVTENSTTKPDTERATSFADADSVTSATSSMTQQSQSASQSKHSLLRSYLEKPKEMLPHSKSIFLVKSSVKTIPSSTSSSLSSSSSSSSLLSTVLLSSSSSLSSPLSCTSVSLSSSPSSSVLSLSSSTPSARTKTLLTKGNGSTSLLPIPAQSQSVTNSSSSSTHLSEPKGIAQTTGQLCLLNATETKKKCSSVLQSVDSKVSFIPSCQKADKRSSSTDDISQAEKAVKSNVDIPSSQRRKSLKLDNAKVSRDQQSVESCARMDNVSEPQTPQLPVTIVLNNWASPSSSPPTILNLNTLTTSASVNLSSETSPKLISSLPSSSPHVSTSLSSSLSVLPPPTLSSSSSSSSSSSPPAALTLLLSKEPTPPPTTPSIASAAAPKSNLGSGTFTAKQDLACSTIYQTLKVSTDESPASENGVMTYNFADIPNTTSPPPRSKCRAGRSKCATTSEINLGDYFPAGTVIPASSIQVLTQHGPNGSQVLLRFGFDSSQNTTKS